MRFQLALLISFLGLVCAAPVQKRRFSDSYKLYTGDGTLAAGWPTKAQWSSYQQLWDANVPLMKKSCGWNNWGTDNSDQEIADINTAIQKIASSSKVDPRVVLVMLMQESKGCVRVPTTNNGVVNPGLFQSHNGAGTCAGLTPCPMSQIEQMIHDGVIGTSSGDGFKALIDWAKTVVGDHTTAVYGAARKYNSGSINWKNLNDGLGSTGCYASDIANRLTGWATAPSGCTA